MKKAGFISFIGRPNVGKSTLMNMFVGEKVAIMSPRAQTTRTMIQAIKTSVDAQIVILDTPGIHKPVDALGTFMNDVTQTVAEGVDIIALLLPANEKIGKGDMYILENVQKMKEANKEIAVFAIVTKIDTVSEEALFLKIAEINELFAFDEIIPVSSKKRNNLDTLEKVIIDYLPESPFLFPEDEVHQVSNRFMIQELIREKVLHLTNEEIPHAIAVELEQFTEHEEEIEIDVAIIVERKSQKGIIIGKQGKMIREIRVQAQRDLKRYFGKRCVLNIWVKVEEKWRSKRHALAKYGYNIDEY